jgi:hypothetical protein
MKPLTDLLTQCTVKLSVPGKGHGTGFFVAPGRILTCGHVVSIQGEPTQKPIKVRWGQQEDFAEAQVLKDNWSINPDVSILAFDDPGSGHPCVFLGKDVQWRDSLYAFGYPDKDFPNGGPVAFQCEGETGDEPPLIKFNLGLIRPGMSGSPILNASTGEVCGMIKYTLGRADNRGGGGVPSSVILSHLQSLVPLQQRFHAEDHRWASAAASFGIGKSYQLNFQVKAEFIDALLKCESMRDRQTRNAIVDALISDIRDMIQRHPSNRVDVYNIVSRCMDFGNGINDLTTILRCFEGKSLCMQHIEKLLEPAGEQ